MKINIEKNFDFS